MKCVEWASKFYSMKVGRKSFSCNEWERPNGRKITTGFNEKLCTLSKDNKGVDIFQEFGGYKKNEKKESKSEK